jgi:hypothetical protein
MTTKASVLLAKVTWLAPGSDLTDEADLVERNQVVELEMLTLYVRATWIQLGE